MDFEFERIPTLLKSIDSPLRRHYSRRRFPHRLDLLRGKKGEYVVFFVVIAVIGSSLTRSSSSVSKLDVVSFIALPDDLK